MSQVRPKTLRPQRYRNLVSAEAILLLVLFVCALGLAYVIHYLQWIYFVSIGCAAGFLYLTLVLRRLEIALVAHLAGLFIVVDAFMGSWPFCGTSIHYSDFILIALLLTFLISGRDRDRIDSKAPSREQSAYLINLFLVGYAISSFASSIVHGLSIDVRNWISFALEGPVLFSLTVWILKDGNRLRPFAIALLLFGLMISLNENSKVFGGSGFIQWRWDSTYSALSGMEASKMGLIGITFAPAMGWPSRVSAFFISLLPLAISYALQNRGTVLRVLSAITVLSVLLNVIALRDRGSWLACGLSLFLLTLFSSRWCQYALVIVSAGLLSILALILTGRMVYAGGYVSLGDWLVSNFASDVRLQILRGIFPALRHLPLFGLGWTPYIWNTLFYAYGSEVTLYEFRLGRAYLTQPHNSYLQLLFATGLLPTLFLISFMAYVWWKAIRVLVKSDDYETRRVLLAALSGTIALCGEAFFANTLWHNVLNALFWMLMGALVAAIEHVQRSTSIL